MSSFKQEKQTFFLDSIKDSKLSCDIFPNIHVEGDMTTLFICILYVRGRKDINVKRHGIAPFELRDRGYRANSFFMRD